MINILADENIPLADTLFTRLGSLTTKAGRDIQPTDLHGVDALLVRSVTHVDAALLAHSQVKFVGSCTIGKDHLDTDYLQQHDIFYTAAPGCNARSVVQYVISVLVTLQRFDPQRYRVGIIGRGNIGSCLYRVLKKLGFSCVYYDPFLTEDNPDAVDFDVVTQQEIVCLHTPLTKTGAHPTYHMVDANVLATLQPGTVLLNAGRGAAIDNAALKAVLKKSATIQVALDVWENEPTIDAELMSLVDIATPHIAGYSFEGKVNGSMMIYQQLAQFLGQSQHQIEHTLNTLKKSVLGENEMMNARTLAEAILRSYDVNADDAALRRQGIAQFDSLRKNYAKRREFSHYSLTSCISGFREHQQHSLQTLGFVW